MNAALKGSEATAPISSFSHGYFPTYKSSLAFTCPQAEDCAGAPKPWVWPAIPSPTPSGPALPHTPSQNILRSSFSISHCLCSQVYPLAQTKASVFQGPASSRLPPFPAYLHLFPAPESVL